MACAAARVGNRSAACWHAKCPIRAPANAEVIGDLLDPIAVAVIDLLAATLPERSATEIQWAYQMMIGTMTFIMADAGRIRAISGGACDPEDVEATIRHIIPLILDGFRNGRATKVE